MRARPKTIQSVSGQNRSLGLNRCRNKAPVSDMTNLGHVPGSATTKDMCERICKRKEKDATPNSGYKCARKGTPLLHAGRITASLMRNDLRRFDAFGARYRNKNHLGKGHTAGSLRWGATEVRRQSRNSWLELSIVAVGPGDNGRLASISLKLIRLPFRRGYARMAQIQRLSWRSSALLWSLRHAPPNGVPKGVS